MVVLKIDVWMGLVGVWIWYGELVCKVIVGVDVCSCGFGVIYIVV